MTKKFKPVIKVKELRLKAGLSQNALSKKSGVSQSHISEIEAGIKRVRVDIVRKLAVALDAKVEDLIDYEEEEEEQPEA